MTNQHFEPLLIRGFRFGFGEETMFTIFDDRRPVVGFDQVQWHKTEQKGGLLLM